MSAEERDEATEPAPLSAVEAKRLADAERLAAESRELDEREDVRLAAAAAEKERAAFFAARSAARAVQRATVEKRAADEAKRAKLTPEEREAIGPDAVLVSDPEAVARFFDT